MEELKNMFGLDIDTKTKWYLRIWYFITRTFAGITRFTRKWSQKLVRKNHLADIEVWNANYEIAKVALKYLQAFLELDKHGYPSYYSDYGMDEETKAKEVSLGNLDPRVAKGEMEPMEAWNADIQKMILSLEYLVIDSGAPPSKESKFYEKWGLDDPFAEKPENEITYYYYDTEGGVLQSTELKENEKPVGYYKSHFNKKALEENSKRYKEGMDLFHKYFDSLWD